MTTAEKWKAIAATTAALDKQLETKGSIVRMSKKLGIVMPSISTGLPSFDWYVSQIGGLPRPRIVELFGPESSGKTTFTLNAIAEEQARGGICSFIDMEHALDCNYAKKLGVNIDDLLVSQPDCGEDGLEIAEALVKSQAVSMIVIDSVAALVPRAELNGDMGDSHMGLAARLMSQACRKLRGICSLYQVPIIFINQIRLNLGGYGSPEVTPGGRALKFYASLRLDVRKVSKADGGEILSGGEQIGHKTRIKAVKNKVGNPFRETVVDLLYGIGYDKESDWVEYASMLGVIKQEGAWYTAPSGERYQGMAKLKAALKNDTSVIATLKSACERARNEQNETV
jgi:recombination protein RecA